MRSISPTRQDLRANHNSALNGQQTLIDFEQSETCQIHRGEMIIAVDANDEALYGCNKCVFERKLEKPRFLVAQAKKTKNEIEQKYESLVHNLEEIE